MDQKFILLIFYIFFYDSNELIKEIKDGFDLNYYFFDKKVENGNCFIILTLVVTLLIIAYIAIHSYKKRIKVEDNNTLN